MSELREVRRQLARSAEIWDTTAALRSNAGAIRPYVNTGASPLIHVNPFTRPCF